MKKSDWIPFKVEFVKIMRIMRLTAVIVFLLSMHVYAESFGQAGKINLKMNANMKEVFEELENVSGYRFVLKYDQSILDRQVNISYTNEKIDQVLEDLLKDTGFTYKVIDRYIAIIPASESTGFTQQQKSVSGKVTDSTGASLPGVSVVVKGTTTGTITDTNGNYSLSIIPENASLQFSFVGMKGQEVAVGEKTTINVSLADEAFGIEEVVAIGYGVQNKRVATAAISQIKSESLKNLAITDFAQGMAGQLSGVQVQETTGAPGAGMSIKIRGLGSITSSSDPLMVIDGIPITGNNSSFLNSNDIESVEVLKDAAAAAIYGSRGSNGVILITTKKGQAGKTKFNLSSYFGFQRVDNMLELTDAYEHAQFKATAINNYWESLSSKNKATDPNSARPASYQIPEYLFPYLEGQRGLVNTDWQKALFMDAPMQNYDLSVSGGNEKTKYFMSGNFLNQNGIIQNTGFKRYVMRMNIETKLSDKVIFGANLSPSYTLRSDVKEGDSYKNDGIIITALVSYPNFPVNYSDGSLAVSHQIKELNAGAGGATVESPVALAKMIENNNERFGFMGNTYLDIELVKGLKIRSSLSGNYFGNRQDYYRPTSLGQYKIAAPTQASGYSATSRTLNWINEDILTYTKTFGVDHDFSAMAGYTIQKETYETNYLNATNFPNDRVHTLNAGQVTSGGSSVSEWSLISYLGRVNYGYKQKYLLNASVRRDGSSRFGNNSKWGWFPSASFGWRVTEEPFLKKSKRLSNLKLRASYGVAGNFLIPNYGSQALLGTNNYILGNQTANGLAPATSPNENLSWEKTAMINAGIDIGFWNNKLSFEADYYNSNTNDLLLDVPVPASSGYTSSLQNIGKVRNEGLELAINTNLKLGKVEWSGRFNISTNRNEVLALGPNQDQIIETLHITKVGSPIGQYYGYKVLGVFNTEAELAAYPHFSSAKVGSYKYADTNADKKLDGNDKTVLGDFFPDYTFGLSSNFKYKNFDISFLIQGVQGIEAWNYVKLYLVNGEGWGVESKDLYNGYYKSPEEPGNGFAKPTVKPSDKYYENSDMIVEDASFVRLRHLTLGYTIPKDISRKLLMDNLYIYMSAKNPLTITNYSGYNPEVTSTGTSWTNKPTTPGVDWGSYPISKSYIIGLNLTF